MKDEFGAFGLELVVIKSGSLGVCIVLEWPSDLLVVVELGLGDSVEKSGPPVDCAIGLVPASLRSNWACLLFCRIPLMKTLLNEGCSCMLLLKKRPCCCLGSPRSGSSFRLNRKLLPPYEDIQTSQSFQYLHVIRLSAYPPEHPSV